MTSFKERIIRAAKLDVSLYEEVEADKGAIGQAMGVVVLSSIAAGVGSIGKGGFRRNFNRDDSSPYRVVSLGLSHLLYWDKITSRSADQSRSR